ncbi:MAG: DNA gyrase modulator, partial [Thermoanaerobaculia bacterium]
MSTNVRSTSPVRDQDESFDILERALAAAGTDEADAMLTSTDQNISRFAGSQIHQNMSEESAALTLRVVIGASMGVASTTVFTSEEIARTAALAREAAKHASPLPGFSGLYRDGEASPDVVSMDERTARLSPVEKAQDLRRMFDAGAPRGATFAGSY